MPIVKLTRRQDVQPALPIIGKLRKGGPKTDPKKPGPDLEYWRFTSDRPEVEQAFRIAYPDNPKVIEAYLPYATVEENWITWMEEYDAGGLLHRCDGETMYRWRMPDGTYMDGERPCPYASGQKQRTKDNPGCKQVGRLLLLVPALIKAGHIGFVTMETHSINDLVSITQCLMDIEKKAGRLNGILMSVMRVQQTISTPAWEEDKRVQGKRSRAKKWLVKVVPHAEWVMAQLERQRREALGISAPAGEIADTSTVFDSDEDSEEEIEAEGVEWDDLEPAPLSATKTRREEIIERLRSQAAQNGRPATDALLKRLWGHLNSLTGDKEKIKKLLNNIFNITSSKELTEGQCLVLIEWIKSKPIGENGEFVPTGPAVAAGEFSELMRGQESLLPDEEQA